MSAERANFRNRSQRRYRRWVGIILASVLLASVLWAALKGYRVYQNARIAWETAQALEGLAREIAADPRDATNLTAVTERLQTMETALVNLQAEIAPLAPLLRRMAWVPRVGGELSAAPDLLEAGVALVTAGRIGAENMAPLIEATQPDVGPQAESEPLGFLARLTPSLATEAPRWQEIGALLDRAQAALARVDPAQLSPELGHRVQQARALLPRVRPLIDLLPQLPNLLGTEGERAYLLVAQNSDELRPTGGFISGVGVVRLRDGQLLDLTFQDSYAVDNLQQPHPPAPDPLRRYMFAELLFLRDANWSPDFPTSAQVIQTLYQLDQGVETHGVIAFDLTAVQQLVRALEPLQVPGSAAPLTGDNVLAQIKAAWEQPAEGVTITENAREWWRRRKDFMPALVQAAIQRLSAGDVNWKEIGRAFWQAATEKHLLIYLNDSEAQRAITALGWDGGLHPGTGDFLAVFDANVGFNKVNAVVTREIEYAVAREADTWTARLVITYTHPVQVSLDRCLHRPEYGRTYEDMTRRCYWDYVRVYVPEGARLIQAKGLDPVSIEVGPGEKGTTVFAGIFVMRPGTQRRLEFTYALPPSIVKEGVYRLRIQKQPGLVTLPVRLIFSPQPGTTWMTEDGQRGDRLQLTLRLRRDFTWEVRQAKRVSP